MNSSNGKVRKDCSLCRLVFRKRPQKRHGGEYAETGDKVRSFCCEHEYKLIIDLPVVGGDDPDRHGEGLLSCEVFKEGVIVDSQQ